MFHFSLRAPVAMALLSLAMATACAAQTYPLAGGETIRLVFAPDGQTLWSEEYRGSLTIRSADGQTEIYRSLRSDRWRDYGGELRVLKDGSFLRATNAGAVKWFEPPQMGQPLRVRRELAPPPVMDWEADDYQPARFNGAPQGAQIYRTQFGRQPSGRAGQAPRGTNLRSAGALALAPDEARVASSVVIRLWDDTRMGFSLGDQPGRQEIIRVWNLRTGAVEMERKVLLPGLRDGQVESSEFPYYPARLGWADAQTLVEARGLSFARFDVTTGRQTSAWQPRDAAQAFGNARATREPKYATLSPAERTIYRKTAPPVPFDVAAQRLMALSDDGRQLVVWDYDKSLLTCWDSATDEAQILSDERRVPPSQARFSSDGMRVAAWNNWDVWSWGRDSQSNEFRPTISQQADFLKERTQEKWRGRFASWRYRASASRGGAIGPRPSSGAFARRRRISGQGQRA